MMVRRSCLILGAALALSARPGAGAAAGVGGARKVASFAKEIARLIKDEMQTEVAVGEFTGPPVPTTTPAPASRWRSSMS